MNRDEPLTPEERELIRLLGRRVEQAPPAALDAAILDAARTAVEAPVADAVASPLAPRRHRTRPRWPAVFGIAASMVFAIGIAWQLRPEAPPVAVGQADVTAAPAAADATAAGQTAAGARADNTVPSAESAAAPAALKAAPAAAPAPVVPAPAPAIAPTREPAPSEAAAPPARRARATAAPAAADASFAAMPPAPAAAPPVRPAPVLPPAPAPASAPAPAPAGALEAARSAAPPIPSPAEAEQAPALDRVEITSASRETSNRSAAGIMRRGSGAGPGAPSVQAEVDADAQLPRRQWLQKIRARRDEGQRDLARASLERYMQQYPEARLPRDLRPLLDD
ncbi:hypothetical protein A9K58_09545 [Stenotrophomonas maltophilia]|uniref:Proline/alanine-rich repetetive membrane anchored protein n=1 Tax=Stenotrophomonas maltophilia TaxID=40324 RepID=A0A1A6XXI3_STEMA|nr:hypothetical protein [Stenotrophomonas maltophilia]OBU67415.1 hypothetical protein A9K58_09545 [Stenotrophomonas maltophilia]